MTRKSFADILNDAGVDVSAEYHSLQALFFKPSYHSEWGRPVCPSDEISESFRTLDIRGTAISMQDFNRRYGFDFESKTDEVSLDDLVSFCEYVTNLVFSYARSAIQYDSIRPTWIAELNEQIESIIELIGYERSRCNSYVIYVEKSPALTMAVEALPEKASYKAIEYNHHSTKGNLTEKRSTLNILANILEPQREKLNSVNGKLASNLFYSFNNLDIRHNNTVPGTSHYQKEVAELDDDGLEKAYDAVYAMCLAAFVLLEHADEIAQIDKQDFH